MNKEKIEKEFKAGDTVYFGTLKGEVIQIKKTNSDDYYPLTVIFETEGLIYFSIDGRILRNTPPVLKHFPYEIQYKEVIPEI